MSTLEVNLEDLVTAQGTSFKDFRDNIVGALSGLDTTDKSSIVNAINEVVAAVVSAGIDTLDELSDVIITAAATGDYLRFNGTHFVDAPLPIADIAAAVHAASSKANPVDADELFLVDSEAGNAGKRLTLANLKNVVVALIVASAPSALDTLDELAAALGDDANFAATVTASLGNKMDKAQNLNDVANKATARTNLSVYSIAQIDALLGNTDADLVAIWNAAIA